jgi:hemerythrin-like domain-containing protein
MKDALAQYKMGHPVTTTRFAANATGYLRHLTQHIDKEEKILFPMADAYLSEGKQEELARGFEWLEQEKIGPGRHEEFHELLHRLKAAYLG